MSDLPKPVRSGGCQCGALRYALRSEPTHTSICWCRMCQKASGNYFQAFTGVPRADFVWTRGQPSTFYSSAAVARDFCRECGTPLTYSRVAVDRISVTVGSLDQPYDFPSEVQYGIENRPHFADRITQGEGITSGQSTASTWQLCHTPTSRSRHTRVAADLVSAAHLAILCRDSGCTYSMPSQSRLLLIISDWRSKSNPSKSGYVANFV